MIIVAGILTLIIRASFDTYESVKSRKDIIVDGSLATKRFTREFRGMTSLISAQETSIQFEYHGSDIVTYQLVDSTLKRQMSGEAQARVLAHNVETANSTFNYYAQDHSQFSNFPLTFTERENVWMVELVLRLTDNVSGQSVQYVANAFPENFVLN